MTMVSKGCGVSLSCGSCEKQYYTSLIVFDQEKKKSQGADGEGGGYLECCYFSTVGLTVYNQPNRNGQFILMYNDAALQIR